VRQLEQVKMLQELIITQVVAQAETARRGLAVVGCLILLAQQIQAAAQVRAKQVIQIHSHKAAAAL
jgi:hypothetical protein